jgi:hypothetical protein
MKNQPKSFRPSFVLTTLLFPSFLSLLLLIYWLCRLDWYIKRTLIYEWAIIIDQKNALEMGETLSVESNSAYLSSLTFIEAADDSNFGHIDIYRTK